MEISFRTVLRDSQSGPERPAAQLIRTPEELAALGFRGELPAGAFDGGPLVVIALGRQPTLAHSVEVTRVTAGSAADEVVVRYRHRTDGPDADALSHPVEVISVPEWVRRCRFDEAP